MKGIDNLMETAEKKQTKQPAGDNKWLKTALSLVGLLFSGLLVYFDYTVFFFDIQYTNKMRFAIVGAVLSVLVCADFLYTRKNFFTCFSGILNMFLFFPMLMMDWGNWPLLIPVAIVTLFGFFSCHINETAKTVFGTVFLLIYILGGIAFYMFANMFQVKTVDTLIAEEASPSGEFRYYMLDVKNKASGKYAVYIQPNRLDKDNGMFRRDTTIKKMVKQVNKPAEISCRWEGDKLLINDEVYFTESKHFERNADGDTVYWIENDNWQYTCFDLDYPLSDTINNIKETIERKIKKMKEEDQKAKEKEANNSSDSESSAQSETAVVSESAADSETTDETGADETVTSEISAEQS